MLQVIFLIQFPIKFYITIADDTLQFLNCVIGQKYLRNVLRLFCEWNYSVLAIDFGVFLEMQIYIFTSQKSSQIWSYF